MNETKNMDRRCRKTRRAIKNALLELLTESDITQISITDISKLADINRKTFYAHYSSVYDIVDDIEAELVDSFSDVVKESELPNGHFDAGIFFSMLNNMVSEDQRYYLFLAKISESSAFFDKAARSMKQVFSERISRDINAPEEMQGFIADYTINGLLGIYRSWLYSDKEVSIEQMAETAQNLFYNGILYYCDVPEKTTSAPVKCHP